MQVPQDGCHLLPERLDVDRERHGKGPLRRGRQDLAARERFPHKHELGGERAWIGGELKRPVAPQLPR